jgi:GNAT superfamily N-acetyltransferase
MYWRIGPAYRKRAPDKKSSGSLPCAPQWPSAGLLAVTGDLAVGWCQLTPRDALALLNTVKEFRRVDDELVWSLSCLYIRTGYRRRRITTSLIQFAIQRAKDAGVSILEAYPVDRALYILDFVYRLSVDVPAARVQGRGVPCSGAPDHANSFEVSSDVPRRPGNCFSAQRRGPPRTAGEASALLL